MVYDGARGADTCSMSRSWENDLLKKNYILVQNKSSVLLYLKCWFYDNIYNFYVYNIVHVHISLIFGRFVCLLVLLLYVPSQQLWSLRDGQFT